LFYGFFFANPFMHRASRWRKFSTDRKTEEKRNWIDGDLIETFLELPPQTAEKIAKAAGSTLKEVMAVIESFARIH
jgi:DNA damage-binding protein 1